MNFHETLATAPTIGRLSGQKSPQAQKPGASRRRPELLDPWQQYVRSWRQRGKREPHAEGLLSLFLGDTEKSVEKLREAVLESPSAVAWNDLAVALLNRSQENDDVFALFEALQALDRAEELSPQHPEILYNRAQVLTSLNTQHLARMAWRGFLEREPRGPWAERALALLLPLETIPQKTRWLRLAEEIKKPGTVPLQPVLEAVQDFPHEVGRLCERELIFEAVHHLKNGSQQQALGWLQTAAQVARQIAAVRGDDLLQDEIARLQALLGDTGPAWASEVQPLLDYFKGLEFYDARKYASAAPVLRKAREGLARAKSPLALAAELLEEISRFYLDAHGTQNNLETLLARAPTRYAELRGRMRWMLGLVLSSRERFEEASAQFLLAADLVRQTSGEGRAAILDLLLAENFDHRGEAARGWRHRRRALAQLPYQLDPQRRYGAWIETSQALRHNGEPTLALLFLKEAEASLLDYHLPYARVEVEVERALALEQLGRVRAAQPHLRKAKDALKAVEESPFKAQLEASIRLAEGILQIQQDPRTAVGLIREAQTTLEASGQRTLELATLLALAEAYRAAVDVEGYEVTLVQAVENLEAVRRDADDLLESIDSFQRAERLFDQLMRQALERPNGLEVAFNWAERSRAQATLDRWQASTHSPTSPPQLATMYQVLDGLEAGVTLIEVILLDDEILCWVFDQQGARLVRLPTPFSEVSPQIRRFRNALIRRDTRARQHGEALFRALLQPLQLSFKPHSHLVIVADPEFSNLPFSALVEPNSGRYLLELTSLSSAPSATLFLRSRDRIKSAAGPLHPLIVGVDTLGSGPYAHLPRLPQAEPEALAIAALFDGVRVLTGHRATRHQIREGLVDANAFHFVGHGISSARDWDASALLLPAISPEDQGLLRVRDVLELPLAGLRLVTLSACETSNGYRGGREGTLSLAMSFFVGGVPEVIGTRWVISDTGSSFLMKRFYHHLTRTPRTAEALRQARLDCLHSPSPVISSTANWAAFEAIGG